MVLEPFHAGNSTRLAGTDFSGGLHGARRGHPNWPVDDARVVETGRYFDAMNFAPAIRAESLVAPVKELNFSNLLEGLTPDPSLAGAGPASLG